MKKLLYIILLLCAVCSSAFAQSKRAYIKAAKKAVSENNTYKALTYYNEALSFDTDDPEMLYESGLQAYKFRAYDMAHRRFSYLIDTLKSSAYPEAQYYLGRILLTQKKYAKARLHLNKYIDNSDKRPTLTTSARINKEKAIWMLDNVDERDKSAHISLMQGVNTPNSEFGASVYNDKIYYTSKDHYEEVDKGKVARSISKLHVKDDRGATLIDGAINQGNMSKAYTTFSGDGVKWYFTECDYTVGDSIRCNIYYRQLNDDGSYNDKVLVPNGINGEGFTSTTPHIALGNDGKERLYFASDRAGGKGKLDIYYTVVNSAGQYSEPVNFEEINTSEDDLAPFYHGNTNTLYFGSDGHIGLGGFDIYAYNLSPDKAPVALKAPVNSSYDDLYYYLSPDEEKGIFSSNRTTSMYLDDVTKACCFDLYKIDYDDVIIEINAMTYDSLTRKELHGVMVYLIDKETGQVVDSVLAQDSHNHMFQLIKERDYELLAQREYYEDYEMAISTHGITESVNITKELYMKCNAMQLDLYTYDNKTKLPLNGVDVVVRNLSDPNAEVLTYNNVDGNYYPMYLPLGSRYEIQLSKFGYVTKREIVDLSDQDIPGIIKRDVYLDVFEIEDYKNTAVYFENDYPDPRSRSGQTATVYSDHYETYVRNKPDYINKVMKNKRIADKQAAIESVDKFFASDVEGGYSLYKKFKRALLNELEKGRKLEVVLKGYASPVAEPKYNATLSERRVNCVKNELLRYKDGVFRHYLGSGALKVTDISYGDTKAPADVSDNPRDIQESVYSIKAARERRVEIIRVTDQIK